MPSDPTVPAVRCDELGDELAGAEEQLLTAPARAHVAGCLRCQAELAGYRRLRRSLRALADTPPQVDPALHHDILSSLDRVDLRRARRVPTRAAATLGGLAAAAGVIALATRQRRGARLAS